jgi:hypothetical protein
MSKKRKFKPEEIKGVLPDGTIVLKEGVRRMYRYYNAPVDSQINQQQVFVDNYYKTMDKMFGDDAANIESYE